MEKYVVGVVVIIFIILFKSLNKKFNEKTEEIEIIKKSGLKPGIHFLDAEKGIEHTKGIVRIPSLEEADKEKGEIKKYVNTSKIFLILAIIYFIYVLYK